MSSINEKNHEIGFVDVTIIAGVDSASQAPSHPIQDGVAVRFRARPQNIGYVYLAFTQTDVTGTDRITLAAGDSVGLRIKNSNLMWAAVQVANEGYEIFAEGPGGA